MCDQQRLRSACAYAQSDQSLCKSLDYSTTAKIPTKQHLKFLSLKWGSTGTSESTLFKMPRCWKSQVAAQIASKRSYTVYSSKHKIRVQTSCSSSIRNWAVLKKEQARMTIKSNNNKPQTSPWHREEEPESTNGHTTGRTHKVKQHALSSSVRLLHISKGQ